MTAQNLRIISWNCRNGPFDEKLALLKDLKPDIAIIPEIPYPGKKDDAHCIWIPSRVTDKKGVAVISSDELNLVMDTPSPDLPEIFLPIQVRGRVTINLLAVWTQKEKNYIGSFEPVLSAYRGFLSAVPSVITGDFNSNAMWDHLHKPFSHSRLVERLDQEFSLVSAYHNFHDIKPGMEEENTFFMYYHEDKPYHIDYCFFPKTWSVNDVKIGTYAAWCQEKKSDHCPLIVDVTIAQ